MVVVGLCKMIVKAIGLPNQNGEAKVLEKHSWRACTDQGWDE